MRFRKTTVFLFVCFFRNISSHRYLIMLVIIKDQICVFMTTETADVLCNYSVSGLASFLHALKKLLFIKPRIRMRFVSNEIIRLFDETLPGWVFCLISSPWNFQNNIYIIFTIIVNSLFINIEQVSKRSSGHIGWPGKHPRLRRLNSGSLTLRAPTCHST